MSSYSRYRKPFRFRAKGLFILLLLAGCATAYLYFTGSISELRTAREILANYEDFKPEVRTSPDFQWVELTGIPSPALNALLKPEPVPDLSGFFSLYALEEGEPWKEGHLPVEGSYARFGDELRFTPKHKLLPGVMYNVMVRYHENVISTSFMLNSPPSDPVFVEQIYPKSTVLPQNLLKFYIQFSGSMTREQVYDHIEILDEAGNPVTDAFLDIPGGLWDPEATRLTLLFDPGRIKRGLAENRLQGVPFEVGKNYTLLIRSSMPDGNGKPLQNEYRKQFTITASDREMPNPNRWNINMPVADTREPVDLIFDEPMDHELLQRVVRVKQDGEYLEGRVEAGVIGNMWQFIPDEKWQSGAYEIEIETILEDLAGNNLKSVFDVDLNEEEGAGSESYEQDTITLSFIIPKDRPGT